MLFRLSSDELEDENENPRPLPKSGINPVESPTNIFQCLTNYILIILRAFSNKGSRCSYSIGDYTSQTDIVYRICSGKQACSISFVNPITLPEYSCTGQIDHSVGVCDIFKSPSYPSYTQAQCANVKLNSVESSNRIIYMYLLDLNIDSPNPSTGECLNDCVLLSYQCNNK
ncbi:unnamed protein product [Rotaria sp. Silwood2]|nr:unnamed protein product [Rotaria sp. Silwood2]